MEGNEASSGLESGQHKITTIYVGRKIIILREIQERRKRDKRSKGGKTQKER